MTARLLLLALLACSGCSIRKNTIAYAFPPGSVAAPWVLSNEVWSGSFAEAAPALGDDAEAWAQFEPQQVWLGVYRHEIDAERRITVRVFSFAAGDEAQRAYALFVPLPDAEPLDIGDAGTWTEIGLVFVWDRLVLEIFGGDPSWSSQLHAVNIAGAIEKRMAHHLPEAPQ